jgi:hypothetical protein
LIIHSRVGGWSGNANEHSGRPPKTKVSRFSLHKKENKGLLITMSKVQLVVYDLSQGMARTLSAQFLGPAFEIPAIPHTGILVYGTYDCFGCLAGRRMNVVVPAALL